MTTATSLDQAFLADFHDTYQFGATPANGVDRQAGTREDGQIRDWFRERAIAAGMEVRVDSVGNLFALYNWDPSLNHVFLGSHLDSQPLGGRFDGCYGVIAALHAAQEINARVQAGELEPVHNLAVVDWFNEEGARFQPSIMGSSVVAGSMDRDKILATKDSKGISVKEALEDIGYLGTDVAPIPTAYAEIHIEQGRLLERHKTEIGAVTQSWYTQKLLVTVNGEQSHTGATYMADRHDALAAAAEIVLKTEAVVDTFPAEEIVTSVGQLTVEPNSPIVVPRQVNMVVDLRAHLRSQVEEARTRLLEQFKEIEARRHLTVLAQDYDIRDHQHYPLEGIELTEKAAAEAGQSCMRIETMAGHDSVPMNRIVPTVMVFVPSVDGVSHCEREFTRDEDLVAGVKVLAEIASKLVSGSLDAVEPGEAEL
ncbi:M20 family metallo-hydrolase [Corynebacterium alimapuense]|uniref:Zn-dependent hydrolase n=1 Tax=Corynebacterium alimapuense TaxID=1576874 RepID=A0A3M8K823_9CORY|nr:M20 family metallo-hydrolase [Corynebacterium alimapuense]RNE49310.1 Zn-dependent hydrolase [Corynebacterium alimapuense]